MKKVLDERLIYEILSAVEEIPAGRVASYGQIARLVGRDRNARLVGNVLSRAEFYGSYPCHRVVNHAGRTAPGGGEQRALLESEGVRFKPNGCVDMKKLPVAGMRAALSSLFCSRASGSPPRPENGRGGEPLML